MSPLLSFDCLSGRTGGHDLTYTSQLGTASSTQPEQHHPQRVVEHVGDDRGDQSS
ncbi:hypothetical protein BH10CYA1_BH10CYA1_32030 [soil metagenome]